MTTTTGHHTTESVLCLFNWVHGINSIL